MQDWTRSSLGERVRHMAKLRAVTLNHLGDRAGIKSGVISRLSRKPMRIGGAPETLQRLAQAWQIDLDWLVSGVGSPDKPAPFVDVRYPNRAKVVAIARAGGMHPEAIDRFLAEDVDLQSDPPELYWMRRLFAAEGVFMLDRLLEKT